MARAKGFLKGNSNFSDVIIDKIGIAICKELPAALSINTHALDAAV